MMPAPILQTQRLTLRGHVMADMAPFWAFYQSPRAEFVGAPETESDMWAKFGSEVGTWDLLGYGGWAVCLKDGTFIGQVALIQPPHFPELEAGWILFDGYEGQGYAFEAATAMLDWAWGHLPNDTLVSYIDPHAKRSIALATKLGATHDADAARPGDETPDDCSVYRHRRAA